MQLFPYGTSIGEDAMRSKSFVHLRPEEIVAYTKRDDSTILVPIGSIEWHSYHLPLGVDGFHAEEIASRLSSRLDCLVFPTQFLGTENYRSPEELRAIGFSGDESVVGVDFPRNTVKSLYLPNDLFRELVKTIVLYLKSLSFHRIILLNGHGAGMQIRTLSTLAQEYSDPSCQVKSIFCFDPSFPILMGHAGELETSLTAAISPEDVDIARLPGKEMLHYKDYGILDAGAFLGKRNQAHSVEADPRTATKAKGERAISSLCDKLYKELC